MQTLAAHTGESLRQRFSWQIVVTLALILGVGFLVLLPIAFLVEKVFNVGDPMAFPAEQLGLANLCSGYSNNLHSHISNLPRRTGMLPIY